MGFFKKLFGRKSTVTETDTPAHSEELDSVEQDVAGEVDEPLPVVSEPATDSDESLPISPSSEADSTEEPGDVGLIRVSSEEALPAQQSIAEMELLEVLEEIETETEDEIYEAAEGVWSQMGSPAQGRRVISLFRDQDDLVHRQRLEQHRSIVQGEAEEVEVTDDEDTRATEVKDSEDLDRVESGGSEESAEVESIIATANDIDADAEEQADADAEEQADADAEEQADADDADSESDDTNADSDDENQNNADDAEADSDAEDDAGENETV